MRRTVEAPRGPLRWKSEQREALSSRWRRRSFDAWASPPLSSPWKCVIDPHDAFNDCSSLDEPHFFKASFSIIAAKYCFFLSFIFLTLHLGKKWTEILMLCFISSLAQTVWAKWFETKSTYWTGLFRSVKPLVLLFLVFRFTLFCTCWSTLTSLHFLCVMCAFIHQMCSCGHCFTVYAIGVWEENFTNFTTRTIKLHCISSHPIHTTLCRIVLHHNDW